MFFALWGLTVPICPLSSYATASELQHLLTDSTTTRLFVHPSLLGLALQAAKRVGLPEDRIYTIEGDVPNRRSFGQMIDGVVARKTPEVRSRPVKHDTLAYLLFSSGTSGVPKSVMVSHTNLVFQMLQTGIVEEALSVVMPVRREEYSFRKRISSFHRNRLRTRLLGLRWASCLSTTHLYAHFACYSRHLGLQSTSGNRLRRPPAYARSSNGV
jgi:acyl-CoA synthetase (AMP-forming)/AMP-acid ligase II